MKNNLKKARVLFSKGMYGAVLRLLEPLIFDYSESQTFFYLLGYSCLFTLDFHGAESYLGKLIRLDNDNIHGLLGLALIHMKREELKEAAALYLQILEKKPQCREAKAGLEYLKKNRDRDRIYSFFDNGKFVCLLPGDSRRKSLLARVLIIIVNLLILAIVTGSITYYFHQKSMIPTRPELAEIEIDDIRSYENGDEGEIRLSEKAIRDSLEKAFDYIDNYRDNLAQIEINRILLSNASYEAKNKAALLAGILKEPKFNTLTDNIPYSSVIEYPGLYENCHVIWSGRAANIITGSDRISFDLLVGYEEGTVLEGIVPSHIYFGTTLHQNMPVEILGRIVIQANGTMSLQVAGIHRIIPGN